MNAEMTKGPIVRTILGLAMPIMASSFLGTLYNICDMAWVGTLGARAVAGVGVGGMYTWLAAGLAMLPRMGGQVLTAQAIGAGEKEKAKAYAKAAIQMILVIGISFGVLSLLFTDQMVGFFHLDDAISETVARGYIRITCGMIFFNFLNITLTGLYTAQGDSKTPMIANFFGLALNMILDPLLITGFWIFPRLESTGAAAATVTAQVVVTAILLIKTRRSKAEYSVLKEQQYFSLCRGKEYSQILRIGTPAALQSMAVCIISMFITRLISGFGPEAVAVARVGGQIESVSWNTADGFSSAINAFSAQNYGAGKFDRIRKGYWFSILASFAWGFLVMLCFVVWPGLISGVFFHEPVAIAISISYLTIIGISEPFMMIEIVTTGALSGLGRTAICSIISILFTALRIPLAYFLLRTPLGLSGMWWTFTSTSIIKGVLFMVVFLMIDRVKRQRLKYDY